MSDQRDGGISWTEQTWNPIRGCLRVSEGCRNCYAETMAARFSGPGMPYEGLAKATPGGPRWTGKVRVVEEHLADPLKWTRPRLVFVNSMSDLFHEALTNEQIAAVFGVMAAAPRHTFQVLTKRAKRMRKWFAWLAKEAHGGAETAICVEAARQATRATLGPKHVPLESFETPAALAPGWDAPWPLSNVWLGVSVEDQASADERIPYLLETPAAVRWVSYEPALGPVDFTDIPVGKNILKPLVGLTWGKRSDGLFTVIGGKGPRLDWIVVGGESGPGARPFDAEWARSTIKACKAADVPCFVKQFGAVPIISDPPRIGLPREKWPEAEWPIGTRFGNPTGDATLNGRVVLLHERKGGDPFEWPEDVRVREWPATTGAKTEARG